MQPLPRTATIAVIGSGAMGAGIAQVAATAGHQVVLFDTRPDAAAQAIDGIGATYAKLVAKGRMGAVESDLARERLRPIASLQDAAGALLVIEAIVEDLAVKRALFAELEGIVGERCILATNTSSISVTAIGAQLAHPERLVGMHFFNPAPLMALVEVVSGLATDRAVAEVVHATAESWGKSPVHARSTPGFIVNRVARPLYAEALRLLLEQGADVATLDAVLRDCGGFRMGPFELMDLIGHDVNFSVTKSVFAAYFGDPRFTPSVLQQELVDAGFLGRKTGRGFYRYGEQAAKPVAQCEPACAAPGPVKYAGAAGSVDALAARLQGAGVDLTVIEAAPGLYCDGAAILLTDGRSATERAQADNHRDTILFDLLFDAASAPRIALARADQCSEAAWAAAVGQIGRASCRERVF